MWWVGNTYRRSAHHARLAVPVDVDARPGFLLDAADVLGRFSRVGRAAIDRRARCCK